MTVLQGDSNSRHPGRSTLQRAQSRDRGSAALVASRSRLSLRLSGMTGAEFMAEPLA